MSHDAYVFDAYGTLFDVHAAVRKHAEIVGQGHARVSEIWRNKQLEYTWTRTLIGEYQDFWLLTEQALDYALASVPGANISAKQSLLDAYWELDCFEEVPTVLQSLKDQGKRLGILSNGTSGMLEGAVTSSGLKDIIDDVISVDRINIFKARPEVYQMVLDDYGMNAASISFQSSNRWDIAGAKAFGFHTIWINRGNAPDEYSDLAPDKIASDLNALL